MTNLRFCEERDLLRLEPRVAVLVPFRDADTGEILNDIRDQLQSAMNEVDRQLRGRRSTVEPFELGRLSIRSQENLRDATAAFWLHFIFLTAQTDDPNPESILAKKAQFWWERANQWLDLESSQLDYDLTRDGLIDEQDKNQPFPRRMIRG